MLRSMKGDLPDRTDVTAIADCLRNLERVLELLEWASRDRLLDEQCDSGEFFQELDLNIPPLKSATSEHGWTSDDDSPWVLLLGHRADEFVQILADPSILVGGFDETLAFGLKNRSGALGCRVYESDDLQPRSEFAEAGRDKIKIYSGTFHSLFETERMVPWTLRRTWNIS